MLVSCRYCGRMHQQGASCPARPKKKLTAFDRRRDPKLKAFRNSKGWGTAKAGAMDRDYHICRVCETEEYGTFRGMRYCSEGLSVHHIIPLAEAEGWERRTDGENLITLCSWHHAMAERGEIPKEFLFKLAEREPGLKV